MFGLEEDVKEKAKLTLELLNDREIQGMEGHYLTTFLPY